MAYTKIKDGKVGQIFWGKNEIMDESLPQLNLFFD
jgi:hypothetical protein